MQTLKTTALVDTARQPIRNGQWTTQKRHVTLLGWRLARSNADDLHNLAADKDYDRMAFRENLREEGVRPLINHRESGPSITRIPHGSTDLAIARE